MATGVRQRHGLKCNLKGRCDCPWEASVYSKRDGKKIRKAFPTMAAAKGWRADKLAAATRGKLRLATAMTLRQAALELIVGMRDGSVPTRTGARYKPATIRGYEESLNLRLLHKLGDRRLADIERVDLQDRRPADGRRCLRVDRAEHARSAARDLPACDPP
jgi:hypothetical protein